MPYLKHQFGQTFYQLRGSKQASGLPIICLYGGPGGHSHFMTDLFKLADNRQVIIYDQIGGGRSSPTEKKHWKVQTFVHELELLVKHLGFKQFHLFGGSWGTTLALEYYLKGRNRRMVASLVFQSPMFSAADWQRDANRLIAKLPPKERKIIRYCHEISATDSKVYQDAMKLYYARHVCRNKAKSKRGALIKNPHGKQVYEHMWGASEFSATGSLKHYDKVGQLEKINCPEDLKIFINCWKRFIDDVLIFFSGSYEELDQFHTYLNSVHPTMKFDEYEHNRENNSCHFLD